MDWRLRKAIQSVVTIAVVAGGGWYVYRQVAGPGDDGGRDQCHRKRAQILEVCNPQCDESAKSLLAAHDQNRAGTRNDCLAACSNDKFNMPMPVCSSRR